MKFCDTVRRRLKARLLARACAETLTRHPEATLAGIILGERSAAWDALADGDVGMALEHMVEARWFGQHSPAARKLAFSMLKELGDVARH